MWFVLIEKNRRMEVHSWHLLEANAKSWAACKDHEGDNVSVAYMPREHLDDFVSDIEKDRKLSDATRGSK